jgi:hypothetical protein
LGLPQGTPLPREFTARARKLEQPQVDKEHRLSVRRLHISAFLAPKAP